MLLNFPEPRMEPFEEFQKENICPNCGEPVDELFKFKFVGFYGCQTCVERFSDPDDIARELGNE